MYLLIRPAVLTSSAALEKARRVIGLGFVRGLDKVNAIIALCHHGFLQTRASNRAFSVKA